MSIKQEWSSMESSSYENWDEIEMLFGHLVSGNLHLVMGNRQLVIGNRKLVICIKPLQIGRSQH